MALHVHLQKLQHAPKHVHAFFGSVSLLGNKGKWTHSDFAKNSFRIFGQRFGIYSIVNIIRRVDKWAGPVISFLPQPFVFFVGLIVLLKF